VTDTIFESMVAIAEAMSVTTGEIGVPPAGTKSRRSEVRGQRSEPKIRSQQKGTPSVTSDL